MALIRGVMSDEIFKHLRTITEPPRVKANELFKQFTDPTNRPLWEIDERFLNPYKELPPIQTWARIGERSAIPKQGLITFSAKQKQGKSLSTYALALPLLSGVEFDTMKPLDLPNMVLVFDMEMSEQTLQNRCLKQLERIGENAKRFLIVPLKAKGLKERRQTIAEMVEQYQPDIVVIDQAAKLMSNINDPTEASEVSGFLDRLSIGRSVWCVIHENKSEQDSNMRGHIGTELSFASVESYTVQRKNGVFCVRYLYGRDTEADNAAEVHFTFSADEGIKDAQMIMEQQAHTYTAELRDLFNPILEAYPNGMQTKEIKIAIMAAMRVKESKADEVLREAVKRNVVAKIQRGVYALPQSDFMGIPVDEEEAAPDPLRDL